MLEIIVTNTRIKTLYREFEKGEINLGFLERIH